MLRNNALRALSALSFVILLHACGSREEQSPPSDDTTGAENGSGGAESPQDTGGELVVGDDACTTDADCVPAGCCHASACVARANGPSCDDVMCTMECRAGTMDCGGSCLCHEGRCAARLMPAPEGSEGELPQ